MECLRNHRRHLRQLEHGLPELPRLEPGLRRPALLHGRYAQLQRLSLRAGTFTPQNKWYLIYHSGPPQYSTADDPTQPQTWTEPQSFFSSHPPTVRASFAGARCTQQRILRYGCASAWRAILMNAFELIERGAKDRAGRSCDVIRDARDRMVH